VKIKYVHIILPSSPTAQVLNYLHQLVRFSLIEEWLADPEGGNGQGGKINVGSLGSP
jgi:hypothetical protein